MLTSHPSHTGDGCPGCNPPARHPSHVHSDYRPPRERR